MLKNIKWFIFWRIVSIALAGLGAFAIAVGAERLAQSFADSQAPQGESAVSTNLSESQFFIAAFVGSASLIAALAIALLLAQQVQRTNDKFCTSSKKQTSVTSIGWEWPLLLKLGIPTMSIPLGLAIHSFVLYSTETLPTAGFFITGTIFFALGAFLGKGFYRKLFETIREAFSTP